MEDTSGEEKELVAAKGTVVEDTAAAAASSESVRGGVPGGVVSIPLSSIIFLQLRCTGGPRECLRGSRKVGDREDGMLRTRLGEDEEEIGRAHV